MNYLYSSKKNGFTLIELLVVLAIIGLLALVVLFAIQDARKVSRDMVRESTAEQLKLAVRLYKEANGVYLDSQGTKEITPGSTLGLQLLPYAKGFKDDPMTSGAGYGYYYDSNFNCTASGQKVVLVQTLEKHAGNINSLCGTVTLPTGWDSNTVFITVVN